MAAILAIEPYELDRARQPIVQPGPTLLDPHRDIEIGESDEKRAENVPIHQIGRGPGERGQERRPDHRVELKQPVQEARHNHQRNNIAEHPRASVERQQSPERTT